MMIGLMINPKNKETIESFQEYKNQEESMTEKTE